MLTAVKMVFAIVFVATLLAGCGCLRTIPHFDQVEVHRSGTQSLILASATGQSVHLVPAVPNEPTVEIPPDGQRTLRFVVVTTESRDDNGAAISGANHNRIEPAGGTRFLTSYGADWVLIAGPLPDPWRHELFFGDCWFPAPARAATHRLEVSGPPVPGLPIHICP